MPGLLRTHVGASSIIFGFLPKKKIGPSAWKHPSRCSFEAGFLYCSAEPAFASLGGCNPTTPRRVSQAACTAESAFFTSIAGCPADPTSVSLAGSTPPTPRRVSQAAWVSAGSDPKRSRIIFQAATLRAPSGGSPVAREQLAQTFEYLLFACSFILLPGK